MKILYQDAALAVVLKPAGMLSQSDAKGAASAVSVLSEEIGTVFPVHRLDRTTEGVMVFARTPDAAARLSRIIADGEMTKTYLAAVHGAPDAACGTFEDLLFYDRRIGKSFVVDRARNGVKKAVLHYETVRRETAVSLISVTLETGRTHQIRVQFAHRRLPLLGDRRYGAADTFKSPALFAKELTFTHPLTGERMTFEAPCDTVREFFARFSVAL